MMHTFSPNRLAITLALLTSCLPLVGNETSSQKTIRVYVDAVCDLFHYGHVNFFRQAREEAQNLYPGCAIHLTVGLCSDADVESYKRTPIMSLEERTRSVEGCRYVDAVIPNCPLRINEDFVKEHGFDLVIHGDDWSEEMLKDYYHVPMALGIFRTVHYTSGVSTTDLMRRVTTRYHEING